MHDIYQTDMIKDILRRSVDLSFSTALCHVHFQGNRVQKLTLLSSNAVSANQTRAFQSSYTVSFVKSTPLEGALRSQLDILVGRNGRDAQCWIIVSMQESDGTSNQLHVGWWGYEKAKKFTLLWRRTPDLTELWPANPIVALLDKGMRVTKTGDEKKICLSESESAIFRGAVYWDSQLHGCNGDVTQRHASIDDSFHLPNFPHMAWVNPSALPNDGNYALAKGPTRVHYRWSSSLIVIVDDLWSLMIISDDDHDDDHW